MLFQGGERRPGPALPPRGGRGAGALGHSHPGSRSQPGIRSHGTVSVALSDTVTKTLLHYPSSFLHSILFVCLLFYPFSVMDPHYHFLGEKYNKPRQLESLRVQVSCGQRSPGQHACG